MEYISVKWIHKNAEEPVLILSELDQRRDEVRKVEIYANGKHDFAGPHGSSGTTSLSIEPIPAVADINSDKQFEAVSIGKWEFEEYWHIATASK